MSTIIKIEDLSKQYKLGIVGSYTIKGDFQRWWYKLRGKEDPFLKIGAKNELSTNGGEYVWALQNINTEIKQGEVVGIIGKNGAGKSTLLKILSRVTGPTQGCIKVKGRIASLLEVGTGFHPELTGKENIFLNGAILGMTKKEIALKLDEIVDFAGVSKYLGTPVKRYSSGMYVRLAFAVAAHLEPDILVVDEVLAVGDAEFQKKAIGKMQEVSKGEGRTVIFVSHNMAAVKSLCDWGIILKNGESFFQGNINETVSKYLMGDSSIPNYREWSTIKAYKNSFFELNSIGIRAKDKQYSDVITMNDSLEFEATYWSIAKKRIDLTLHFKDEFGQKIFSTGSTQVNENKNLFREIHNVSMVIPPKFLNWGNYYIDLYVVEDKQKAVLIINDILTFTIISNQLKIGHWLGREPGSVIPNFVWEKN